MRLSVVIPVFNERRTIEEIIRRVGSAQPDLDMEIVVVDDGSTDGTREILQAVAERGLPDSFRENCKVIVRFHDRNRGKGAAVRTGLELVSGDLVLIQDADLEYNPRDYPLLLEPILEGQADVVFGNRFHGGPHRVLYFWHYVGNRVVTLLANVLTGLNLSDMEVGYKVFRADVLRRIALRSDRFGFEPEITVKVAKLGCRIYEVPIRYYGRAYEEGKKITWRDGLAALFHLLRHRFFA